MREHGGTALGGAATGSVAISLPARAPFSIQPRSRRGWSDEFADPSAISSASESSAST